MSTTNEYFVHDRKEVLEFIPKEATKILDVGCASGIFGKQLLERQKCEVWGVEPNADAATAAGKILTKVENSLFPGKLELPKHYFDCIIFNDVLEHMYDPWEALRYCAGLLDQSTDSVIVASIPNFRYWHNLMEIIVKKKWDYKKEGLLDKTHMRFFTEHSIQKMFFDCGYEVTRCQGINPTPSKKMKLLNGFLLNSIRDMKYLQFVTIARLKH